MSFTNRNANLGNTQQASDQAIDTFKNFGFMKPNRFEIVINGAPNGPRPTRQVQFHVKEITLPDRSLRTVANSNIYGPMHDIVQGQTYGSLNATFYLSSDMTEKLYFEEWQKTTFDPFSFDLNYYNEYVGSIEIYTLDEKDERKHGVRVEEAFPDTIGTVALSQDTSTAVGTLSVGFKYRFFRTIGFETRGRGGPFAR